MVSGGFTVFTDRFVAELGLDFAAANELEIVDGVVTGQVARADHRPPGQGRRRCAGSPPSTACRCRRRSRSGDGANDIDMLEAAGLGIAFNAKAALRAAADTSVNLPFLDTVLFVLGIPREEIDEADADRLGLTGRER